MENDNSGQNESQPARKRRRKAPSETNQATQPAQADAPVSPADAQETGSPEAQEQATQEPQPANAALPAPADAVETDAPQPEAAPEQHEADAPPQADASGSQDEQPAAAEPDEARQADVAEPDEGAQAEPVAQGEPAESQPEPAGAAEAEAGPLEAGETEEETEEGEAAEADDRMPDGLPVRQVVEALLFATDSPLPAGKIAQILERGTSRHVRRFIAELNEAYEREGRAFRIEEVAGGYQMLTVAALQPWLAKLLRARQESRLSPTQMETLAVIAYKQPVLRAAVEVVRGVACGDVINRLREVGLVKIVGRAEDVGRPLLYGTTKKFLRVFGLGSLDDLPRVEELRPPEATETAEPPQAAPQPAEPPQAAQTPQADEPPQAAPAPAEPEPAEPPQEPPPATAGQ